jgi:hypothetical protein
VTSASVAVDEAGGTLTDLAALRVCYAVTPWSAADGGPMVEAPAPDCSNQAVALAREAGVWRADISPFTAGRTGLVSVMVVPDPAAVSGLPAAYDVQFDAPALTAVAAASAAAPPRQPAPAPSAAPVFDPEPGPQASFFAPLTPPDPVLPPAAGVIAPESGAPQVELPGRIADPSGPDAPSRWRWQLWLQLILIAAVAGATAGTARWALTTGPLQSRTLTR